MIDDVPCNHCVHYFRGLYFHPDPDLSLDALHLSGPSYHTSGEEGVTLDAVHFPQSTAAAAADVPYGEVLACPPGSPLHFSSRRIAELYDWPAWPGLECETYTVDPTWTQT